jgi:hypothetical protein
MCATWRDSLNTYSQLIRWSPLQWIIVALVKPLNVVAIEALVTDLHPGTQRAHGRKFLDGEPDRLCCGRKAAIAQLLSPTLALAHEQFGGYAVVECHSSRSAGFAFMLNPITEIDRKGLFGRQASGLLSQEGKALVRQSLRQPLLRKLLRSPVLLRLLELPLSLLLVILRRGCCSYGLRSGRSPDWLKMKNPHSPSASRNRHVCHGETRAD